MVVAIGDHRNQLLLGATYEGSQVGFSQHTELGHWTEGR